MAETIWGMRSPGDKAMVELDELSGGPGVVTILGDFDRVRIPPGIPQSGQNRKVLRDGMAACGLCGKKDDDWHVTRVLDLGPVAAEDGDRFYLFECRTSGWGLAAGAASWWSADNVANERVRLP